MPKIDDFTIANIRDRAPLIDIIGKTVTLKERGRNWVGLCPFHADKNPSFSVNPRKGIFKCWSCGAGGDVFKFLQLRDGLPFLDAIKYVGEQIGIQIDIHASGEPAQNTQVLYDVLADAQRMYEDMLWKTPQAREYLKKRKINDDTVRAFGIGYAPADEWEFLMSRIGPGSGPNHSLENLCRAGVAKERKRSQGCFDLLRGRIIFPIADLVGRPIAFAGRDITNEPETPKYLNTPATPLYDKSKILYGVNTGTPLIKEAREVVVVEGYVDAVAGQQHRFPMVATGGTAFTDHHAELLYRRFPGIEKIILAFDGDGAGERAAIKGAPKLLGRGNAFVAFIPHEEDPASMLEQEGQTLFDSGRNRLASLLEQGTPVFDFYLDKKIGARNITDPAQAGRILTEIAQDLTGIPGDVVPLYVETIARKSQFSTDSLYEVLGLERHNALRGRSMPSREHCEIELLHGMMAFDGVRERFRGLLTRDLFSSPERRAVCEYILGGETIASVHAPLLQSPSDATARIMERDPELRPHILAHLLSPPPAAKKRNLRYCDDMFAFIQSWAAFDVVQTARRAGHGLARLSYLPTESGRTIEEWARVDEILGAEERTNERGPLLMVRRSWEGLEIANAFGNLGEYLVNHAATFTRDIASSLALDVRPTDRMVCIDVEDTPSQIISAGFTQFIGGTLDATVLFARNPEEEPNALSDFLRSVAKYDKVITFNGSHDMAAMRTRTSYHSGALARAVKPVQEKHRDIFQIVERYTRGKVSDKGLQTAERFLFGDWRGDYDLPSREVPAAYEAYLRTGDIRYVAGIVEHNLRDTIGPLALLHAASAA